MYTSCSEFLKNRMAKKKVSMGLYFLLKCIKGTVFFLNSFFFFLEIWHMYSMVSNCTSYFSCYCDQIPRKKQLKGRRVYFVLEFEEKLHIMSGKELEEPGPTDPQSWRWISLHRSSVFFLLSSQSDTTGQEILQLSLGVGIHTSIRLSGYIFTDTHSLISCVILMSMKNHN